MRSRRLAILAVLSLLVGGVVAAGPTGLPSAEADPGHPQIPDDPREVFWEDFEYELGTTPVDLDEYVGAPPLSPAYTAHENWLTGCNGHIVSFDAPDSDLSETTCTQLQYFSNLRQLAYGLGAHAGAGDPGANHAVTAYTSNDPMPGNIQFETVDPIALPDANGHYLTFSVDSAAVNCGVSAPGYQFFLVDGDTAIEVGGVIDACTAQSDYPVPAVGGLGARDMPAATFTSDGSILFEGTEFGIRMINTNGSGTGNDAAFDNIRVLEATPQLDKTFEPGTALWGNEIVLTFTVTNTSELAAKEGWSFTDTLPDGMTVAGPGASTCADPTIDAPIGLGTIAVSGDLSTGMEYCTISLPVAVDGLGEYTNDADDVTTIGLLPPADATVTVTDNSWECSAFGYLFQSPDGNDGDHEVHQVDLATGESVEIGQTAVNVNAVGYNLLDDFVYGWDFENGVLVRVGADLSVSTVSDPPEITYANVGDFDDEGYLWLLATGGDRPWYQVDLVPQSDDYGQVVASGVIGSTDYGFPADWTFIDGAFYGVSQSNLMQFDPTTGTATSLGVIDGVTGLFGASYADAAGHLYVSDNTTGNIFRIDVEDVSGQLISGGPSSNGNDGMRCADAAIPTLELTKEVDGRSLPDDQFEVTLSRADEPVLTIATTGTETSVSSTDWPVSQGQEYTITDAMAAGSPNPLEAYEATIECVDLTDSTPVEVAGTGPWTITIGAAHDYSCTVTNRALISDLTVVKSASPSDQAAYVEGQDITYSFVVTNTGETVLSDIAVTEVSFTGTEPLPDATCLDTTLAPGDQTICTTVYELSQGDVDNGSITNIATATGVPPAGPPPVSPPSQVTVPHAQEPALSVVKTAGLDEISEAGQVVEYEFLVTNEGNVTITDAGVAEAGFSGAGTISEVACPAEAATLLPGQFVICTASYTVVAADLRTGTLENTATATGSAPSGDPIESDPSTAVVSVDGPPLATTGADAWPLIAAMLALLGAGTVLLLTRLRQRPAGRE